MKYWWGARVAAGVAILAPIARAQSPTPQPIRFDSLPRPTVASPPANPSIPSAVHVCLDACPGSGPRSRVMPDVIIKDSARRVLAQIPHRDLAQPHTNAQQFPTVEPEMVGNIEVFPDSSLAPTRREIADGLVVVTLSPAGTRAWGEALANSRKRAKRELR